MNKPAPFTDETALRLWSGDAPRPVLGSNKVLAFAQAIIAARDKQWEALLAAPKDGCEICHGAKGGVPGNENVIDGKLVCDYCHAAPQQEPIEVILTYNHDQVVKVVVAGVTHYEVDLSPKPYFQVCWAHGWGGSYSSEEEASEDCLSLCGHGRSIREVKPTDEGYKDNRYLEITEKRIKVSAQPVAQPVNQEMLKALKDVLATCKTWNNDDDLVWMQYRLPGIIAKAEAQQERKPYANADAGVYGPEYVQPVARQQETFEQARERGAFKPAMDCCPTWYATVLREEGWNAAKAQPVAQPIVGKATETECEHGVPWKYACGPCDREDEEPVATKQAEGT